MTPGDIASYCKFISASHTSDRNKAEGRNGGGRLMWLVLAKAGQRKSRPQSESGPSEGGEDRKTR